MRYKAADLVPDAQLAALFERFADDHPHHARTLVLNGDIFDFDLVTATPPPGAAGFSVRRGERVYGLDPTAPKSVFKLQRMLADHPTFVRALARRAAAGDRVVYVLGNHDREIHFPSVQETLRQAVLAAARAQGLALEPAQAIAFEPWFLRDPGVIYVEHGNQYDMWSSFAHVLAPTVPVGSRGGAKPAGSLGGDQQEPVATEDPDDQVALPMGNFSCRYLLNRMGFFNPHANNFMLSGFRYLAHWLKHYAFTRRSLIGSWLWGSVQTFFGMLATRRRVRAAGDDQHLAARDALAARHGLAPQVLAALDDLREQPVTSKQFRIFRELWLDRVALAMLLVGATVALAVTPIPLWVKLMVPLSTFPLLFLMYDGLFRESIFDYEGRLADRGREIARLVGCPVVVMGHTHRAMAVPIARGQVFANSGTWAPTWVGDDPSRPEPGRRNYVLVRAPGGDVPATPQPMPDVSVGSWLPPAQSP